MNDRLFHCVGCSGIFESKLKAWTVTDMDGNSSYVCKLCDRKYDEEEVRTYCNACKKKADNMKKIKDPDTKKKINVCDVCYDEITRS